MMNETCKDRERIFEDGTPGEWAALEAHADSCPACAEELKAWKSLSVAAQELRDYTENPSFWPRIERALAEEAQRNTQRTVRRGWLTFLPGISLGWQPPRQAPLFWCWRSLPAGSIFTRPVVSRKATNHF